MLLVLKMLLRSVVDNPSCYDFIILTTFILQCKNTASAVCVIRLVCAVVAAAVVPYAAAV
jgi:hypothetical protein